MVLGPQLLANYKSERALGTYLNLDSGLQNSDIVHHVICIVVYLSSSFIQRWQKLQQTRRRIFLKS